MNKKGSAGIVIIIILLIIGAIVFVLLNFLKGGLGGLLGKGSNNKTEKPAAEAMAPAETNETEYIEVTVDVNDYILDDETVTIDDIIAKKGDDVAVRVIDKNASKNAYDALIAELDKNEISYIEAVSDEDSAA